VSTYRFKQDHQSSERTETTAWQWIVISNSYYGCACQSPIRFWPVRTATDELFSHMLSLDDCLFSLFTIDPKISWRGERPFADWFPASRLSKIKIQNFLLSQRTASFPTFICDWIQFSVVMKRKTLFSNNDHQAALGGMLEVVFCDFKETPELTKWEKIYEKSMWTDTRERCWSNNYPNKDHVHITIASLSRSKGKRVQAYLIPSRNGCQRFSRSRRRRSWERKFFSTETKFSSWSLEKMRGFQERDYVIVMERESNPWYL